MSEDLIELAKLKRAIEKKVIDGICDVWLLDWKMLARLDENALIPFLDISSLDRLLGIIRQERRLQFILGRILLKLVVSAKTGVLFTRITIKEHPGYPPSISTNGWLFNDIHFSISHSQNFIGCGVSLAKPIGLDIEVIEKSRNIDEMAQIGFQENERDWLMQQPTELKHSRFNLIWTRKESCYKLLSAKTNSAKGQNIYQINALDNSVFHWESWKKNNLVASVCSLF